MSTLIIAEAGVNHEMRLAVAEELVDIAIRAKVDVFKSQTFTAEEVVTKDCEAADYQIDNVGAANQYDMLKKLELPRDWHPSLKARCEKGGIEFLSTAFGFESFDYLMNLGLERIKIPSGEISNLPFVVHQARHGLPMILSTGMANMDEIKNALGAVISGIRNDNTINVDTIKAAYENADARKLLQGRVTVLHCTTDYPVKWPEVNMRALPSMARELGLPVGYSDHTPGLVASFAAVALGATIIEKHYTISRAWASKEEQDLHPSPDHAASLEPLELKALVEGIRMTEAAIKTIPANDEAALMQAVKDICFKMEEKYGVKSYVEQLDTLLGSAEKTPTEGAAKVAKVAKRSVVVVRPIQPGDEFTTDNLALKRPAGGLPPETLFELLGRRSTEAYAPDQLLPRSAVPKLVA